METISRRKFLGITGCLASGLALLRANKAVAEQKVRWKLILPFPKTIPIFGEAAKRFVKNVETATDGNFKIRIYGAGELIPAFSELDAVSAGTAQISYTVAYYYMGKIPELVYFSNPPFSFDMVGFVNWLTKSGNALLEKLLEKYGIKHIYAGSSHHQVVGWFNKEINKVEDLKGLKIRVSGLSSKIYEKVGAVPVLLPGGELFTSLATGVIDAVEWTGPYGDYLLGFHKVTKYMYTGSWHEPATPFFYLINKKAYDALPESYKRVLYLSAMDTANYVMGRYTLTNIEYLHKIQQEGRIKIRGLPKPILIKLKSVAEDVIQETAKQSKMAKEIYNSFSSYLKDYLDWDRRSTDYRDV